MLKIEELDNGFGEKKLALMVGGYGVVTTAKALTEAERTPWPVEQHSEARRYYHHKRRPGQVNLYARAEGYILEIVGDAVLTLSEDDYEVLRPYFLNAGNSGGSFAGVDNVRGAGYGYNVRGERDG